MMENNNQLLSVKDAAKALAISERTLYALTVAGRIKSVKIGLRCVRYDTADLAAFISACKGGIQ